MLAEDVLLLAFNDATSARSPLSLATSVDGGATWQKLVMLESAPAGSFHYPTAHLVGEDTLAVIYSVDVLPHDHEVPSWRVPHEVPAARVPVPQQLGVSNNTGVLAVTGAVYRQGSSKAVPHVRSLARNSEPLGSLSDAESRLEVGMGLIGETRENAWGRVSLGMRLALASRVDLVRAARAAAPHGYPSGVSALTVPTLLEQ